MTEIASVRFVDAPVEHGSDTETNGTTQALVDSRSRRTAAPNSTYHTELLSASLSYSLSGTTPYLYDQDESDTEDHGAPGSRRYRRYLNTIVSDYESETDIEEDADPHIVRFEWKSDFIAAGDAFFQGGGQTETKSIPRISRQRRHRLPTHNSDGEMMLYGQELAPYLYRRMDTRVRPLLKKMPERDCHLITQLEHLIRAFKNDSWRWDHRAKIDAKRELQREIERDEYHERLQSMTLSSSPDTDSSIGSPESTTRTSMSLGTPPSLSHLPTTTPPSPPSPIHRSRFTVAEYLASHRPTAFTLLPSSAVSTPSRDRRRARHERRRRQRHQSHDSDDDDDEDYVVVDGNDDDTLILVFQDAFQRFLAHGILHFHQLQSTSETLGRSKPQRVTYVTKTPSTSSKPVYTHNASLHIHLQQLYAARLARQQAKPQTTL